jgi:transcriptional regulator with XRE-family HTH domain
MRKPKQSLSDGFSRVVSKHREKQGLSRSEVARLAGLHQTYIGLLERGQRTPNLDTADAIAKALHVPLTQLVREASKAKVG